MTSRCTDASPGIVLATTVSQSHPLWGDLPRLLVERAISVHLVSSEAERPAWIPEDIAYSSIPMHRGVSPLGDGVAAVRWYRLLTSLQPRAVIAATPKAGMLAMASARLAGIPIRHFHVWGCRWDRKRGPVSMLAKLGDVIAAASASKMFAVGPEVARVFQDGIAGSPHIEVFPYLGSKGVDVTRFVPTERGAHHTPTIGFLGRWTADKGFFLLPEIIERVRTRVPNARLLIGGLPDRPTEVASVCRQLRRMQGVSLAGFIDDVPGFLSQIDVLCFPSIREGLPNAVIEAAACGVPTVGWRVTGLGDAVIHGKTGYLTSWGNVNGMVEHIVEILVNPTLRQSLSHAAREFAESRFDHRRVAECQLSAVLEELGVPRDTQRPSAPRPAPSTLSLPAWPKFAEDELEAASAVLRSGRVNYWTGTVCRDFEAAWSNHLAWSSDVTATPAPASLCFANGTLTLDAALHAMGIGPGDEVIVSPRTYVANAMCVVMAGATPVFADVDADSGCITAETAEAVRTPRTRAIIPVHVGGWPCDMPELCAWGHQHGIQLIEDCAQAHGAHIEGRPVGTFGSIASWSFCQDKIITTGGEGGMLSVHDAALLRRCWAYAQHGKDHDQALDLHGRASAPGFKWLVAHQGTNCRMTEMQAAIGLAQLKKLPGWLAARRRNGTILSEALSGIPGVRVPVSPPGHSFYRFTCFIEGVEACGGDARDAVLRELHYAGLPASVGSCGEVYLEPYFQLHGIAPREPLPVARRLAETSLSLPCHPTIDADTMRSYAKAVSTVLADTLSRMPITVSTQLAAVQA